jgi:ectoine hydroxylase-related dioxygenase (phytanoyl-CoA dioxygenase family)
MVQRVNPDVTGVARFKHKVRATVDAISGARTRGAPSSTPSHEPFVAAEASADAAELRTQMAEHGHLFFRGLIPQDSVLDARAEALALCRDAGWIDPEAGPLEARWSGHAPTPADADPEWLAFYRRWVGAKAFNSLPEHPSIVKVAEKLLGDNVLVHPRKIGRVGFPQNEGHQTPVHQDFFHIGGTAETYTAWIPLGDCPQRLGCLSVAEATHTLGFREHGPSAGPGGWSVDPGADATWRSEDFGTGDVVIFHSLTMHRALPNRTTDEVRISLDNRYQRAGDTIDPGSLKPHI